MPAVQPQNHHISLQLHNLFKIVSETVHAGGYNQRRSTCDQSRGGNQFHFHPSGLNLKVDQCVA